MPMGVGLAVLSYPIVNVLYPNSNQAGPGLLSIMGVASFFVCIVLMENAILQASGKERLPMIALVTGSVLKIIINWIIIAIPAVNIFGAPVGTLCGYCCMAVIDYIFIRRSLGENPNLAKALGRPFLCSLVMGIAAFAVYRLASAVLGTGSSLKMLLSLGTAVLVAVVIYLSAVIQTRTITNADMKLIPGGERIGRLLHMKDS
jgi:stage V sporulation protein B